MANIDLTWADIDILPQVASTPVDYVLFQQYGKCIKTWGFGVAAGSVVIDANENDIGNVGLITFMVGGGINSDVDLNSHSLTEVKTIAVTDTQTGTFGIAVSIQNTSAVAHVAAGILRLSAGNLANDNAIICCVAGAGTSTPFVVYADGHSHFNGLVSTFAPADNLDALIVGNAAGTKYLTVKPEHASGVCELSYWNVSTYGLIQSKGRFHVLDNNHPYTDAAAGVGSIKVGESQNTDAGLLLGMNDTGSSTSTGWIQGVKAGSYTFPLILNGIGSDVVITLGTWNTGHVLIGPCHLWWDATAGRLRAKATAPGFEADGSALW